MPNKNGNAEKIELMPVGTALARPRPSSTRIACYQEKDADGLKLSLLAWEGCRTKELTVVDVCFILLGVA
jgi:hypothetical protein